MSQIWLSEYQSPLGVGAVASTVQGVCQVWLPGDHDLDSAFRKGAAASDLSSAAAEQLQHYFQRRLQHFDIPVDLAGIPPFRQQVLRTACMIPYGKVFSYKQLAEQAGCPGAARAVGGAMAANPIPLIIPCHRVVSASGALTGYSGAGGLSMKRFLLNLEAADFRSKFF